MFETQIKREADVVIERAFGGTYEIVKDRRGDRKGQIVIWSEIEDIMDSGQKVVIVNFETK